MATPSSSPKPTTPIFHGRVWPVGLELAARRIGCTRGHLQQVLKGRRISGPVKEAYAALVAELTGSGLNESPDSKPQNTHIMPTVVIIAGRPPIQPDPASLLKAKLPGQPQCPQPPLSRSLEEMRLGAECLRLKAALVQQAEKITRLEEENRALTKAVHRLA
jgi:hypothetical protein